MKDCNSHKWHVSKIGIKMFLHCERHRGEVRQSSPVGHFVEGYTERHTIPNRQFIKKMYAQQQVSLFLYPPPREHPSVKVFLVLRGFAHARGISRMRSTRKE
jgi:hypothetical protein